MGTPCEPGSPSPAGASHEDLVGQVKEQQRRSCAARQAWSAHCDLHGGGVRDPRRHCGDFLAGFLAGYSGGRIAGAAPGGEAELVEVTSREPALGRGQLTLRMPASEEGILKEVVSTNVYGFLPGKACVLREGDTVLDVGAHVGVAAALALCTQNVRVVCVEPHPTTFSILRENMAKYGDSAVCVNKAVTDRGGTLPLYIHSGTNAPSRLYFSSLYDTRRHSDETISVACAPFQELVDRYNPTVIKIDAEGGERFLGSLSDFRDVRLITAEWDWTHNRSRGEWERAESHLRCHGFAVEVKGRMPPFDDAGNADLYSAGGKKRGNTGMIFTASRSVGAHAVTAARTLAQAVASDPCVREDRAGVEREDGGCLAATVAQPALREQLAALTVEQLEARLEALGEPARPPRPEEFVQGFRAARRAELLDALCAEYASRAVSQPRLVLLAAGVPLPADATRELLQALRMMVWTENVRPAVRAAGYVVLKRPWQLSVEPRWRPEDPRAVRRRVWELSEAMLRAASARAAEFDFSAIAVSRNFHGSPHVDKNDLSVQYAVSLGDFEDGSGRLCVEEGPFLVRAFDTKEKLVCIDGRFPHWVSSYTGERYSIIYYRSAGAYEPPVRAVHEV